MESNLMMWALLVAVLMASADVNHAGDSGAETNGLSAPQRIVFNEEMTFATGSDGIDTYVITESSPVTVSINNKANNNLLDYLVIPNSLGETLRVNYLPKDAPFAKRSSPNDIVVRFQASKTSSPRRNVILQSYMKNESYQHLIIQRDNNKNYMILLKHWTDNPRKIYLIKYISMRDTRHNVVHDIFPNNNDSDYILHVSNINDKLEAHVRNRVHVVLTFAQKNVSSVAVVLHNFIQQDGHNSVISKKWWYLTFFITNSITNSFAKNKTYRILDIYGIMELLRISIDNEKETVGYNIRKSTRTNLKMDRDVDEHSLKKLPSSILTVHEGLRIEEISARWNTTDETLSICVKNTTVCLVISHWCKSPEHRLRMIIFKNMGPGYPSIKFSNIDLLECKEPYNAEQNNLVNALQRHFDVAIELFKLAPNNADTDNYVFKKCIALNYLNKIAKGLSMSRILDFKGIHDEEKFQYVKCLNPQIMSRVYFEKVKLGDIRSLIENNIDRYNIKRTLPTTPNWPDADAAIETYRKSVMPDDEWYKLLSAMYNRVDPTDPIDFKSLDMMRNGNVSLPTSVE